MVDFITAHCNMDMNFDIDVNLNCHMQPNMNSLIGEENEGNTMASETSSLPPHDQCNSPLNFIQQYSYGNQNNRMKSDNIFEDSQGSFLLDKSQQFGEANDIADLGSQVDESSVNSLYGISVCD